MTVSFDSQRFVLAVLSLIERYVSRSKKAMSNMRVGSFARHYLDAVRAGAAQVGGDPFKGQFAGFGLRAYLLTEYLDGYEPTFVRSAE